MRHQQSSLKSSTIDPQRHDEQQHQDVGVYGSADILPPRTLVDFLQAKEAGVSTPVRQLGTKYSRGCTGGLGGTAGIRKFHTCTTAQCDIQPEVAITHTRTGQ